MMDIEKFNENELKNALLVELSWLKEAYSFNSENGISLNTLQEKLGI